MRRIEKLALGLPVITCDDLAWDSRDPPTLVFLGGLGVSPQLLAATMKYLTGRGMAHRTIVLAPLAPDIARTIAATGCRNVYWLGSDDIEASLRGEVAASLKVDTRRKMWESLVIRLGEDALLGRAISVACLGPSPPSSVEDLARRSYGATATLRKHWRMQGLPDSPAALVEWAAIAEAASQMLTSQERSKRSAGTAVRDVTLQRRVARRLGCKVNEISPDLVFAKFARWLG